MDDFEKMSYALGMNLFQNLSSLPVKLNLNTVLRALTAGLEDNDFELAPEEYRKEMQKFQEMVESAGKNALNEAIAKNRAAGKDFLAKNAKLEGVKTTPSGLQYKILKAGSGAHPGPTSKVRVHYTGKLIDGTVFDSSVQRGEPAEFGLNQVIRGWTEGLQLMQPGAKAEFYIPSELGYGDRGAAGAIPPAAALIFEVELLAIL